MRNMQKSMAALGSLQIQYTASGPSTSTSTTLRACIMLTAETTFSKSTKLLAAISQSKRQRLKTSHFAVSWGLACTWSNQFPPKHLARRKRKTRRKTRNSYADTVKQVSPSQEQASLLVEVWWHNAWCVSSHGQRSLMWHEDRL